MLQDTVRFLLRCFFRLIKIRFELNFDLKDLPKKGIYISNHVSYVDPIVLFAFLPGRPIFALHGQLYRNYWVRLFMKTADIMEYGNLDIPDLKHLIEKVNSERLCVIFPEGRMTTNGNIMKIYESAGLLADKTDVRRNRVRPKEMSNFDIHDRVNYAVTEAKLKVNPDKKMITLNLQIDENICSMLEYFEIFLQRMLMCRRAAEMLGVKFKLTANGSKIV